MAALKIFSLASASALLMANAVHQTAKQTPLTARTVSSTYSVNIGETAVCLGEINDAREAAGLAHFIAANDGELAWPATSRGDSEQTSDAWDPVCNALIAKDSGEKAKKGTGTSEFKSGTYAFMALSTDKVDCAAAVDHWKDALDNFTSLPPSKAEGDSLYDKPENKDSEEGNPKGAGTSEFKSGTYAFMALTTGQADCAAAVDHWKAAVSNFASLPPSKTEGEELYDKPENVSFVAMYNPSDSAAADCRVVTCTQTPAPEGKSLKLRSSTEAKNGYALLCMTTPDLMTADSPAPFSEDQWSKIKASLTGSASVAAPSLIAFAIAALGLAAF
ncbi:SAG family member [Eimeria mitis]|uniref:SAG family member n=1 Tax=Eimeria mitis TaxID=44415 RepID=U6KCE7_9EIME|nr:SAG family member [Eimeria mitis]CDJ33882.1 SAG family member [Eimeria mitis]